MDSVCGDDAIIEKKRRYHFRRKRRRRQLATRIISNRNVIVDLSNQYLGNVSRSAPDVKVADQPVVKLRMTV